MINIEGRKLLELKHPDIVSKFKDYNTLNYLNIVDRTFYMIRLREEIYRRFSSVISPDFKLVDENTILEPKSIQLWRDLNTKKEKLDAAIINLDQLCISIISKNLDSIKYLYDMADYASLMKKPFPTILNDYNCLVISLFFFPINKWWKIVLMEIEKKYGAKRESNRAALDDVEQMRRKMLCLPEEIKNRIGSTDIKIYKSNGAYINISTTILDFVLRKLPINEKIGNLNFDDKLIVLEMLEEDRKSLLFTHETNEIYAILNYFARDYLNIHSPDSQSTLKLFIKKHTVASSELGQLVGELNKAHLDFINDDNVVDFFAFLKFMKNMGIIKKGNLNQNKCADRFPTFTNVTFASGTLKKKFVGENLSENIKSEFLKFIPFKKLTAKV